MGKKSGPSDTASSIALAKISEQLFEDTEGLRSGLLGRSEDFVSGGFDPLQTQTFGAAKGAMDAQFDRAKQNTLASTPRGGQLVDALSNIEAQRATAIGNMAGGIQSDELARATNLASGFTSQGMGGYGQSAAIQGQLAASNAQAKGAKKGGMGQGIGILLGGGIA